MILFECVIYSNNYHETMATLSSQSQICQYGVKCYRKNPLHYEKFSHPWLFENIEMMPGLVCIFCNQEFEKCGRYEYDDCYCNGVETPTLTPTSSTTVSSLNVFKHTSGHECNSCLDSVEQSTETSCVNNILYESEFESEDTYVIDKEYYSQLKHKQVLPPSLVENIRVCENYSCLKVSPGESSLCVGLSFEHGGKHHAFSVKTNTYGRTVFHYLGSKDTQYKISRSWSDVDITPKHKSLFFYCFQQIIDHYYGYGLNTEWFDGDNDELFLLTDNCRWIPFNMASDVRKLFSSDGDSESDDTQSYYSDSDTQSYYSDSDTQSYYSDSDSDDTQ
jgi:hypothetical protein